VGRTSSSETTHLLRWRLEERCAITQPAAWPAAPRGRPNWPATALKTARFTAMPGSPPVVFCTADSQRLQVPLKSRCGRQRRTEPPSRHATNTKGRINNHEHIVGHGVPLSGDQRILPLIRNPGVPPLSPPFAPSAAG
jgi:hypothetical protein